MKKREIFENGVPEKKNTVTETLFNTALAMNAYRFTYFHYSCCCKKKNLTITIFPLAREIYNVWSAFINRSKRSCTKFMAKT